MKNFNEIYNKIYNEQNDIVEKVRKKELNIFLLIISIGIMVSLTLYLMTFNSSAMLFLLIMLSIGFLFLIKGEHNNLYKHHIIKTLIRESFSDLSYMPKARMSIIRYSDAEFELFNKYTSEDYIRGKIEDEYIEIAEVKVQKEIKDSEGRKKKTTLFHGLFCSVKLEKYIPTKIKIRSNKEILDKIIESNSRLEMDSSEFEKYFDVYTEDRITGMQIITSDLMLKMIEARQKIKKEFEITIKNKYIYIRIKCGEVFEANKFKETMHYDTLKFYYDMLNELFEISKLISNNIKLIEGE